MVSEKIQQPGRTQHPCAHHEAGKRRQNPHDDLHPLPGSGNERFVDIFLLKQTVSHDIENDEWYRKF